MARVCPTCGARFDDRVAQCPNDGAATLVVGDEQGLIGKTIDGRFTIRGLIGVGGMGAVYRAHQHSMDRDVALKVLHKDLASNEQEVMRFFREAKAASSLTGAHTITVFDFGQTDDGMLYLVMELLKGRSLADHLEQHPGPMDPRQAVKIIRQVLDALVQAHAAGVLHRDLKPDNIFLVEEDDSRDFVKVLDFGIAKIMGRETTNLTATGMVVGTPTYMSPEQGLGEDLDQRSDLYSVGAILFELLAGRPPFEAETPVAVVVKKVHEPAPKVRQVNPSAPVSAALESLVARILATDPNNRPSDARETRSLLKQVMGSGFEAKAPELPGPAEPGKTEIGKTVPPTTTVGAPTSASQPARKTPPPAMRPRPSMPISAQTKAPRSTARRPKARRVRKEKPRTGLAAAAVVALALTLALVIWAMYGWETGSKTGESKKPVAPPTSSRTPNSLAELPLSGNPGLPPGIENEARLLLASMSGGNLVDSALHLEKISQMRDARQIGNLTALAAVFLSRFDEATAEASPARAARLAGTALGLAPDYPDLYFKLASAQLRRGVAGFGAAASAFVRGLVTSSRYPRGVIVEAANGSFYLLLALLAVVFAVSLLLLAAHGSKLIHDVGDIFYAAPAGGSALAGRSESGRSGLRRFATRAPIALVVALALFFPFLAGLGLLTSMVLVLLAVGLYADRSEITAIVLALLSVFLLVPLGIATHLPLDTDASLGSTIWSCTQEYCPEDQTAVLDRAITANPDGTWTYVGLAYSRIHNAPSSPAALSAAIRYLEAATPDRQGTVDTFLGNVRVLHALASCPDGAPHTGSLAAAVESYEKATKGVHEPAEALRGLAVAQGLLGKRKAMKETIDRLVGLTHESDLTFQEKIPTATSDHDVCGALPVLAAELRVPRPPDWQLYLQGLNLAGLEPAIPMRGLLLGNLPPKSLPLAAIIGLLFLPAAVLFGGRYRLATRCPRCGNISCGKCDVRASGFDYC
ncbi:MAG: protein kinase, partial [Deltaproteobacteria bacterium]|nr:protein kinase [Deltaproteobacteria bacterium]